MRHKNYLEGEEMYEYFFDMIFCQKLAQLNRRVMLKLILNYLHEDYEADRIIESIHNYIDFNDMIFRKGAISAKENELCIVSLNMRDGILLCEGKGNIDWNYSCCHGSGRILNRTRAKEVLRMSDFTDTMNTANVYSTSVTKNTLDEAPMAYKDSEMIKNAIEPTARILQQLKPLLNIKSQD